MLTNSYIGASEAKAQIIPLVKKTAESQFKIGVILKELQDKVKSYENKDDAKKKDGAYKTAQMEYKNLIESELPFGKVVANKLVQIASDPAIEKYLDQIPFAYNTMYELKGMTTKQWNFYFKQGLDGKSTAKQIKEMKKKWLAKTQPKVNEEPTEQEVQETQQQVKELTGKKDVVISEEVATALTKSFAEPVVEVKVFETSMTSAQYALLEKVMNEVISDFFKSEKLDGKFKVQMNPNILFDDPELAVAA